MKRNNIVLICILLAVFILGLTGFSLAPAYTDENNASPEYQEDRLIGMFITTESLDLNDTSSSLAINSSELAAGSETSITDKIPESSRIYATLIDTSITNEETGEVFSSKEYVFNDIEGIRFFAATIGDASKKYLSTIADEVVSDVHTSINATDNGSSYGSNNNIEGSIYALLSTNDRVFYFNPVFQTADGSVYLTEGMGAAGNMMDEAGTFYHKLDAAYTHTEDGVVTTDNFSVTLSVYALSTPNKFTIIQVDKANTVISKDEYEPEKVPETITPNDKTAYIIAESLRLDLNGDEVISREIYEREDNTLFSFSIGANDMCIKKQSNLNWK